MVLRLLLWVPLEALAQLVFVRVSTQAVSIRAVSTLLTLSHRQEEEAACFTKSGHRMGT
jgi:hypothetical protein